MSIRIDSAGKVLLTGAGRVRTCTCCDNSGTLYRRIFDCCASCRFVWVPSAYLDTLGAEWNGTLLIAGKCYSGPETAEYTREEIEQTWPDTDIYDTGFDDSELGCAAARAADFCPECQDCCITGYVSRVCFTGVQPPDRPSVCCNWGRQFLLTFTQTVINETTYIYDTLNGTLGPGPCACNYPPGLGVVTTTSYTRGGSCRVRRECDPEHPQYGCTLTTLSEFCTGTGCPPGADEYLACGGITGTRTVNPCNFDDLIPVAVSCGETEDDCYRFEQIRQPGDGNCFECGTEPLRPDCDIRIDDVQRTCSRNCFGGIKDFQAQARFFFTSFCRGQDCPLCGGCGKCPCVEAYQCQMHTSEFSVDIAEWSVTVEDTEGCEIDPCTEYNGQSDCPPQVSPPGNQCSEEGGCPDIWGLI